MLMVCMVKGVQWLSAVPHPWCTISSQLADSTKVCCMLLLNARILL